ncbi:MAG: SRPBCC family protein [Acidimicrobiales bacterium]
MTTQHHELEVSRLIRADRDRVFEAWTDPAQIVAWWGAGGVVCTHAEMDLRVGGTYRISNQMPGGPTMWITGTFSVVDAPMRLEYSWAMEPLTEESDYSVVEVTFGEADGGTLVTVAQTRIPSSEVHDMHLAGWIGCLDGLAALVGRD